jgi:hypothetical protein
LAATQIDARLVVELSKLAAMLNRNEAVRAVLAPEFDPETADVSDPSVQKILNFSETVATLVKHDVLDRDLVFDWFWVAGFWDRLGGAAERARARTGSAALYENVEALATS